MKKILIALAATTAIAAAVPAAAQPWRGYDDNYAGAQRLTSRVDGLEWQINRAVQERRISRGEARDLMADLRRAQPIAWKVQTGRANNWERRELDRLVGHIEQSLTRYARYDRRDNRNYGYGYGPQYRR